MSYILDALRKSEQERQPGKPVRPGGPVHNLSLPWRGGWLLVIGIIFLLVMLAAAVIFWRGTVKRFAPEETPVIASAPVAAQIAAPHSVEPVAVATTPGMVPLRASYGTSGNGPSHKS